MKGEILSVELGTIYTWVTVCRAAIHEVAGIKGGAETGSRRENVADGEMSR